MAPIEAYCWQPHGSPRSIAECRALLNPEWQVLGRPGLGYEDSAFLGILGSRCCLSLSLLRGGPGFILVTFDLDWPVAFLSTVLYLSARLTLLCIDLLETTRVAYPASKYRKPVLQTFMRLQYDGRHHRSDRNLNNRTKKKKPACIEVGFGEISSIKHARTTWGMSYPILDKVRASRSVCLRALHTRPSKKCHAFPFSPRLEVGKITP